MTQPCSQDGLQDCFFDERNPCPSEQDAWGDQDGLDVAELVFQHDLQGCFSYVQSLSSSASDGWDALDGLVLLGLLVPGTLQGNFFDGRKAF